MENKTAMTVFINWFEAFTKNGDMPTKDEILWQTTELRDTVEKEQIIEANKKGYQSNSLKSLQHCKRIATEYYNQTYNQ